VRAGVRLVRGDVHSIGQNRAWIGSQVKSGPCSGRDGTRV